jgi:hypothetical protein
MKTYNSPALITYGDVESITQSAGTRNTEDFDFFNGRSVPNTGGGNPGRGGPRNNGSADIR